VETKDLIQKIHRLEIKTKGLTRQILSGEYHSAFKGRGMAFSEVRDYHFGDEVRTIDWNVTARYNTPYVKVFEEERELTVMLVIDISGSEEFGTTEKTKKELALEIAAVIAFSAVANNDKVGALFVSDKMERYIAPAKGKKHVLFILRELIEFKPKSKLTNLNEGLRFLRNTQKKRTISFIISDFIDSNNFMEGMRLTKKRHDTIAIKISDNAEKTLLDVGLVQLFNAETSETTWVNSSAKWVRETFKANFMEEESNTLFSFKKAGIDCVSCSTDQDIVKALVKLFHQR